MLENTEMIKCIIDENRLRELEQVIWKKDHEELLFWLCDGSLCSKVLDVIPKFDD